VSGFFTGDGFRAYSTGNTYRGQWKSGQRHGDGFFETKNATYEGQFVEGRYHGQGILEQKKNKTRYEGEFVDTKQHGYGVMRWPDGRVYSGEFVEGKRCGRGKMKYPDGRLLDGIWEDNHFLSSSEGLQSEVDLSAKQGSDQTTASEQQAWQTPNPGDSTMKRSAEEPSTSHESMQRPNLSETLGLGRVDDHEAASDGFTTPPRQVVNYERQKDATSSPLTLSPDGAPAGTPLGTPMRVDSKAAAIAKAKALLQAQRTLLETPSYRTPKQFSRSPSRSPEAHHGFEKLESDEAVGFHAMGFHAGHKAGLRAATTDSMEVYKTADEPVVEDAPGNTPSKSIAERRGVVVKPIRIPTPRESPRKVQNSSHYARSATPRQQGAMVVAETQQSIWYGVAASVLAAMGIGLWYVQTRKLRQR